MAIIARRNDLCYAKYYDSGYNIENARRCEYSRLHLYPRKELGSWISKSLMNILKKGGAQGNDLCYTNNHDSGSNMEKARHREYSRSHLCPQNRLGLFKLLKKFTMVLLPF